MLTQHCSKSIHIPTITKALDKLETFNQNMKPYNYTENNPVQNQYTFQSRQSA